MSSGVFFNGKSYFQIEIGKTGLNTDTKYCTSCSWKAVLIGVAWSLQTSNETYKNVMHFTLALMQQEEEFYCSINAAINFEHKYL